MVSLLPTLQMHVHATQTPVIYFYQQLLGNSLSWVLLQLLLLSM